MQDQPGGGHVELICGSMFSGKTEELLRRIRRAEIARRTIQIFKPRLDHRYGLERVASHNGVAREDAVVVENAAAILELVRPETEVVAIDEVQFFDWAIADVCSTLADRGQRVIAAGLDPRFAECGPLVVMPVSEQVDEMQVVALIEIGRELAVPARVDAIVSRHEPFVQLRAGSLADLRDDFNRILSMKDIFWIVGQFQT